MLNEDHREGANDAGEAGAGSSAEPSSTHLTLATLAQLADLEVLAASVPIGIFRSVPRRGNVYVNRRLLEITGLTEEHALGRGWMQAVHPEDRDRIDAERAAAERELRELAIEYRVVRPDGDTRWVRVRSSPLFAGDGRYEGFVGSMEDVTERIAIEAKAARLTAVCELTTDFVVVGDASGRLLYVNPAARRVLGLDEAADLDSLLPANLYAPTCREQLETVGTVAANEGSWTGELALRAPDESEIPVSQVTFAHRGHDGQIECFSSVMRDISAEKAVERELVLRSAKLRSLIEQAADVVIVLDAAGVVTDVGESLVDFNGAEPGEWIGNPLPELVHPDDRDKVAASFRGAILSGSGTSEDVMYRVPHRDGSWVWFESRITNLLGDDAVRAVVATTWDETERARVAEALRESEERFRSLAASSPVGIVYADSEGRVQYVNQRWREISGLDADVEATWERIHPDDVDRVVAESGEALAAGREVSTRYRIVRPSGVVRFVRSTAAQVLDARGEIIGYIGSVDDVTDEMAARAHSDRLAALLENTPDLAVITDVSGRVLYLNRRAREVLGLAAEADRQVGSARAIDLFAPRVRRFIGDELAAELRREGIWSGELAVLDPDGQEIPVSVVTLAHVGADGEVDFYSTIARDISGLKSAEAKLGASESWFRSLVQEALDLVAVSDADDRLVYVSPSVARSLGFRAEDLVAGDGVSVEIHPDDQQRVRQEYADVKSRPGATVRVEYRVRHREGSWRWLESRVTNLLDDPAVQGVVTNSQDVTERRVAEDARARSDSALRALVQASPLAILTIEPDFSVQLWNRACEELFAWNAEEVLGRPVPFVVDEGRAEADDLVARVFAGETVKGVEGRFRRGDGRSIDVNLSVAPVRDAQGRVVSVMAIVADVTDRKRAEEGLRASEERFRALVQNSSDFVVVYTDDGTVSYASPSVERFAGHDAGDLLGSEHAPLIHTEDQAIARDVLGELREEPGGTRVFEVRMRRYDGEYRWVEITATNLRDDPNVGGIVLNSRDVTERREAEAALRESEERFRALVQHGSDMVTVLNSDGTVRFANPGGARLMGHPADWGLGMNPLQLMHPDDVERISGVLGRALSTPGVTGPTELRLRHADGSYRTIEAVAKNLVDDPAVNGIIITAHDVTERKEAEEQVRRSEERLRALVQNLSDVITVVDEHGRLSYTSPASNRLFGFEDHDETWADPLASVHPDDKEELERRMEDMLSTGVTDPVPFRLRHRDGSWRNVEVVASNLLEDPAVAGIVVTTRDVTERTRAEAMVAAQAQVLELVARGAALAETLSAMCEVVEANIAGARGAVMLFDESSGRLRVGASPSLPEGFVSALVAGIPVAEEEGACGTAAFRRAEVVAPDVEQEPVSEAYRRAMAAAGLRASWSTPILSSSGDRVLGSFAVYWPDRRGPASDDRRVIDVFVHLAAIAIERKASEERLEFQAHHDPLTGLPNRTLFLEFLMLALARARRRKTATAVLFLDLDSFKFINDSLGHDRGDELLIAVGQRLQQVLRPGDTIARFGGDEFTVLCEDLDGPDNRQQAIDLAERLLEAIQAPFVLDGEDRFLGASIGISLAADNREVPDGLLRDADAAMYRAKEHGKGRWELFDEQMRASARARVETESALHRALERREFRLFYQPIVSLSEARYVGVEALVRWDHPERGLVAPHEFVTLAEETGLIVPLGAWVLEEVCRQYGAWQRQLGIDPDLVVSVNLSGKQIAQSDLVETVGRTIERAGIRPQNVSLEITESVLLDDTGAALKTLGALKALGVQLSMDDFGTGYSSLGYLKRFPVDSVKVDRSFVDGLGTDPEDSAIVAGVVSLGRALGLTVVGEGVETEEQLAELVSLGCDQAQGFFFSPPRPPDEVAPLLVAGGGPLRVPGSALMDQARLELARRELAIRTRRSAS